MNNKPVVASLADVDPQFLGELKLYLEQNPPMTPWAAVQGDPLIVTGSVDTDATILDGNGFTATHTGTGVYTVAFDTAHTFAAAPDIQVTLASDLAMLAPVIVAGWDGTGFVVKTRNNSAVATDCAFTFTARPTL